MKVVLPPMVGEIWVLKSNFKKYAKVLKVNPDGNFGGHVWLSTPWTKNGESGKCMDVFLKQYCPTQLIR